MDPDTELQLELIRQTGLVLVALIGILGSVLVVLLNRTRQHAKATRYQVENNHKINMRDEQDTRHRQNTSRLAVVERRVGGVEKDIGRIADHLGIERTTPRPPRKRAP